MIKYSVATNFKILVTVMIFWGIISAADVFGKQAADTITIENLWKGEWQSSNYKSVKGSLSARIPDNFIPEQQFSVDVDITYHPDSFYKPGKIINVVFNGMITREGRVDGGGDAKIDKDTNTRLSLKGSPAWSLHVIEYDASILEKENLIIGKYRTKWPSDKGTFTLHFIEQ